MVKAFRIEVKDAKGRWNVVYRGDVTVRENGIGKWKKKGARVLGLAWREIVSSNGVRGMDAGEAGLEIFPPLALHEMDKEMQFIDTQ